MSLLNLEYNYKKGTNEFSFSLKVMSTVNRRNGRNRDALLAAGGAAAAGVGTAIGNAALRNIQHNAQAAGTSLLNSISNVFRAEDFRSHPDSTGTGSHDSVQNSQAAQPSYEAPTSSKRPRVEQAEPDSTATDSELMSRAGSGGGSSGGGGAMQAVGGDPFIARPLSHTYQKMSFYFSKRHYFRISTFLPKVYYGTNSEVSPNNFLLDPTYVFDFSSPVWYLNEQEYNQLWGAMQVYTVQENIMQPKFDWWDNKHHLSPTLNHNYQPTRIYHLQLKLDQTLKLRFLLAWLKLILQVEVDRYFPKLHHSQEIVTGNGFTINLWYPRSDNPVHTAAVVDQSP